MKQRLLLGSLLILALASSQRVLPRVRAAHSRRSTESDCDCFLINGSNPTYYNEHMFFDFRDLNDYAGVPGSITSSATDNSNAPPTSDYFSEDDWTSVWQLQGWDNRVGNGDKLSNGATTLMVNTPNNVYIQESGDDDDTDSDTFLTLRTKRLPDFQSAAEFQTTTSDYHFVSLRVLARTVGSPGACTAIFTYRDADKLADVQEADIEILTGGPRDLVQYTNQPSYSTDGDTFPEATSNTTMPGDLRWTEWVVHRLDWTPEESIWYVNGEQTARIAFQTPKDPAQIHFNAWSNGNSWTGKMPLYDEAFLQIQWIQLVFNRTDDGGGGDRRRAVTSVGGGLGRRDDSEGGCSVVCSVDDVDSPGDISVLWEGKASARIGGSRDLMVSGLLVLVVLVFRLH